jgi:hypothetical protein
VFTTQLPRDSMAGSLLEGIASSGDLRRVAYWLGSSGDNSQGLLRQELFQVTSEEAGQPLPELSDPTSKNIKIVGPEVKSLTFRYFDGTSWQESWDGTTLGADGITPIGPPVAIEITIGLAPRSSSSEGEAQLKTYRHVVYIPTNNISTQAQQSSTPESSGQTTPGTSSP